MRDAALAALAVPAIGLDHAHNYAMEQCECHHDLVAGTGIVWAAIDLEFGAEQTTCPLYQEHMYNDVVAGRSTSYLWTPDGEPITGSWRTS